MVNSLSFLSRNYVLNMSKGIDQLGRVDWKLALCLLLAWIIVCLCLSKGVASSGKVRNDKCYSSSSSSSSSSSRSSGSSSSSSSMKYQQE